MADTHGSTESIVSGSTREASGSSKARMIAVAVTAVALLAIAIPFVWQPNVEAEPAAASTADGPTPALAHEGDTAACMANPKPANFDFTMKEIGRASCRERV